jgi:peptide/nickel transport system permease protein
MKAITAMIPASFRRGEVVFGIVLLAILLAGFLGWPLVSHADPLKLDIVNRLKPPSLGHPFGTDDFGRDVLSRVMYGGRLSLGVGFMVAIVACVVGTLLGLVAGFIRPADAPISRFLDALMAFPDILLAIALMAAFGPSLLNAVIALGLVYTPRIARVVRAATLVQRELLFVEAAISMGASRSRILRVHIFPNLLAPLFVQATFVFAYAMLTEAALSFLGAGVPPELPTLGNMISAGQPYFGRADWMMLFPGMAIALAVLALQTLGDGLRDALDPVLSRVR